MNDRATEVEGPCGPVSPELLEAVDAATARFLGEGVALRDGQRAAVLAALTSDTLAVLPPAAGKTAVYAVAGEVLGGRTVVVSPTLSLHRDQVAHLRDAGVPTGALNSEAGRGDLGRFVAGELEVLVTPDACVVVRDVDRPHTHLAVRLVHDERAKWDQVVETVVAAEGAGIVYVTTRGHTTLVADRLTEAGVTAGAYHGGLPKKERPRVQDAFMAGELDVVVATSAFGMGIDKPDVRWVVHGDVPTSIDAYHQEIGRAGRDGGSAWAVLFHRPQDLARPRLFASGRDARAAALATVVEAVRLHREDGVIQSELADAAGLSRAALARAVPALVVGGSARQLPARRLGAGPCEDPAIEVAKAAAELVIRSRQRQVSKVELVRRYAEGSGCRRRTLLETLGEARDDPCGFCDHCDEGDVGDPGGRSGASHGEPTPGEAVAHDEWGRGVVQTVEDDTVVVLFDEAGYRTLSIPVIRERGLLTSA